MSKVDNALVLLYFEHNNAKRFEKLKNGGLNDAREADSLTNRGGYPEPLPWPARETEDDT